MLVIRKLLEYTIKDGIRCRTSRWRIYIIRRKQHVCTFLLCIFLIALLPVTTFAAEREEIVIFYENDVHCAVEGYAKLAALKAAETAEHLGGVIGEEYAEAQDRIVLADDAATYTVQPGDTLWAIALAHECTIDEIVARNRDLIWNPDLIYAGWVLDLTA